MTAAVDDEVETSSALERALALLQGSDCKRCGKHLCGHEYVLAVLLGTRHTPRCRDCTASEMNEAAPALSERALQWILRRDCYKEAWRAASAEEGFGRVDRPQCLFSSSPSEDPAASDLMTEHCTEGAAKEPPHDTSLDAGNLGCGDLVLRLRNEMKQLAPGTVVLVTALDPAAPIDLPAWCGLVGHTLLHQSHPRYWIQRKKP